MGCRVIYGRQGAENGTHCGVLYCTTSGKAFGPIFESGGQANEFLDWLRENPSKELTATYRRQSFFDGKDAREYTEKGLEKKYLEFIRQKEPAKT